MSADAQVSDDAIMQHMAAIKDEIAAAQPLIADMEHDFQGLKQAMQHNPRFAAKIQELDNAYKGIRRVRGDGNCFYRCYLFQILVYLSQTADSTQMQHFMTLVQESKDKLINFGFPDYAIEDAHEEFVVLLQWIQETHPSEQEIKEKLETDQLMLYLIMYLRFVTSYHLLANQELFQPFYDDGRLILEIVRSDVEPMDREADQQQVVALVTELGIPVRIAQMTQADDQPLSFVDVGSDQPVVHLLFRPGHYDILISK